MKKLKKEYKCSLVLANDLLGGKWKLLILWYIMQGKNRFSLLQKAIPDITHKVLITNLKELEEMNIIKKYNFSQKTLHIEYHINDENGELYDLVNSLCRYAESYAEKENIRLDK